MNAEELRALPKTAILETSKKLSKQDVVFLVDTLAEKDDAMRYNAFLLLQANSKLTPDVHAHWRTLESKLESSNSYQRSLGLMLMAENVRWDREDKFGRILNRYLECCMDEKFITARQAIQGLANVVAATNSYDSKIQQALTILALDKYKPNQQDLLKKDAANILELIEKKHR